MKPNVKLLTGETGEYYVAYELSLRKYSVGIMRGGSQNWDLMVGNPANGKTVSIQVKTMREAHVGRKRDKTEWWKWWVSKKSVDAKSPTFFAFVSLLDGEGRPNPETFVFRSSEVFTILESGEDEGWFVLDSPDGEKRKGDSGWRLIIEELGEVQ